MKRAAKKHEERHGMRGDAQPAPRPPAKAPAQVEAEVAELLAPVLATSGCTLDRVVHRPVGRRGLLQVFIDKDGGVGVDDCANVSRQLSVLLDQADVVPGAYTLEVSSPGLTRPLSGEADFRRFAGRLAVVQCRVPTPRGDYRLSGRLRGVEDGALLVEDEEGGMTHRVALSDVKGARLEIDDTGHGQPRDGAQSAAPGGGTRKAGERR